MPIQLIAREDFFQLRTQDRFLDECLDGASDLVSRVELNEWLGPKLARVQLRAHPLPDVIVAYVDEATNIAFVAFNGATVQG